jgi:hypothetical protein
MNSPIGKAFDIEQFDARTHLREKFAELAAADAKANDGLYLNAPYKVRIGDETYKGTIRVHSKPDDDGTRDVKNDTYTIVIERPVKHMTSIEVMNPYR